MTLLGREKKGIITDRKVYVPESSPGPRGGYIDESEVSRHGPDTRNPSFWARIGAGGTVIENLGLFERFSNSRGVNR